MKKFGLASTRHYGSNYRPRKSRITSRTCLFCSDCLRRVPLLQKERIHSLEIVLGSCPAHRLILRSFECTCFHRDHRPAWRSTMYGINGKAQKTTTSSQMSPTIHS